MKQLVLAEKPSMGADIARTLGVKDGSRQHGLIEGPSNVVTWCVGHLVELAEPHEYRPEWKHWSPRTLPILPEQFKLRPRKGADDQWRVVAKQLQRRDIGEVINACDAGREGELIFRMVYELSGCEKPVRRLWISSLTGEAIREGFRRLRPAAEYDDLAAAAHCRNQADWLVGINATRATTLLGRKSGPDAPLLSVGRVQTPTLAMLAERDATIESFVTEDYFELWAEFDRGDLRYRGRWRGPEGESRFKAIEKAREVEAEVSGKNGLVEEMEQKTVEEKPPLLFDLTSLQRTANARFGLSAARTLAVAQALYEKHKLITYPRTDSRFLTPDLLPTMRDRVEAVATGPYAEWARPLLQAGALPSIGRHVQAAKVKDHHAILPTAKTPALEALGPEERKVYDLIVRRFLGVFYPPARFADVVVITRVDAHRFRSHGRTMLEAGWRAVAGFDEEKSRSRKGKKKEDESPEEPEPDAGAELLGRLRQGDRVQVAETGVEEKQTKPPQRYTDASLLAAMEGAGRLVDDEALRDAMKDQGLGTPATRAAIIETLLDRGYVERDGKAIRVTAAGKGLLATLSVEELKSPELTGRWEARLSRMARGEETAGRFMQDIRRFVAEATSRILGGKPPPPIRDVVGRCPSCGAEVTAGARFFECKTAAEGICRVRIPRMVAGKPLTGKVVEELLAHGRTRPVKGFRSKTGKTFQAALVLDPEGGVKLDFDAPAEAPRTRRVKPGARAETPASAPRQEPGKTLRRADAPATTPRRRARKITPKSGTPAGTPPRKDRSARSRPEARAATAWAPSGGALPSPAATPSTPEARAATAWAPSGVARPSRGATPATPSLEELGPTCPVCERGKLLTGRRGWGCSRWKEGCPFVLWFEVAGRKLTQAQARELITKGRTRPLSGFRDELGQPYKARLVLQRQTAAGKLEPAVLREPL